MNRSRKAFLLFLILVIGLEVAGISYGKAQVTEEGILSRQTIQKVAKKELSDPNQSVISVNGWCSGFIAKKNYVVTARHCVDNLDLPYTILFHDGSSAPGFVYKIGEDADWAIIKTYTGSLPIAHVANKPLGVGQLLYHIRYIAHEEHQYQTYGVYAGMYCDHPLVGTEECLHWMGMAAVGGDSGGPVFTLDGYVIGIMSRGYIFAPMAMAVPASFALAEIP